MRSFFVLLLALIFPVAAHAFVVVVVRRRRFAGSGRTIRTTKTTMATTTTMSPLYTSSSSSSSASLRETTTTQLFMTVTDNSNSNITTTTTDLVDGGAPSSMMTMATTTTTGEGQLVEQQQQQAVPDDFLVHRGRTADMIYRAPAISGLVIFRGWTTAATRDLKAAVQSVVKHNPILTGYPYQIKEDFFADHGELWIKPGKYTPETHDFLTQIDPPSLDDLNKPLSGMSSSELLEFAQTKLFPCYGELELTAQQAKRKLPVFSSTLMLLPDSYAVFSAKMSHTVGDGATFFNVVKHISLYMSGKTTSQIPPIDWTAPTKFNHEFYPDSFSKRDVDVSYGLPFIAGLIKNGPSLAWRKQTLFLLDKNLVNKKKRELRSKLNSTSISSNDVITAAICEINVDTDLFVFTENARGNGGGGGEDGVPSNAGGNFIWEIPIAKDAAQNPIEFRKTVISKAYYKTNELPLEKFLCGKVGRLTSLATVTEQVVYDGLETLCTIPNPSFVSSIPMDVALIFRYDKQYWAVLHNFATTKSSQLMDDIIAKGV